MEAHVHALSMYVNSALGRMTQCFSLLGEWVLVSDESRTETHTHMFIKKLIYARAESHGATDFLKYQCRPMRVQCRQKFRFCYGCYCK